MVTGAAYWCLECQKVHVTPDPDSCPHCGSAEYKLHRVKDQHPFEDGEEVPMFSSPYMNFIAEGI